MMKLSSGFQGCFPETEYGKQTVVTGFFYPKFKLPHTGRELVEVDVFGQDELEPTTGEEEGIPQEPGLEARKLCRTASYDRGGGETEPWCSNSCVSTTFVTSCLSEVSTPVDGTFTSVLVIAREL